jgi:hypothetical protein
MSGLATPADSQMSILSAVLDGSQTGSRQYTLPNDNVLWVSVSSIVLGFSYSLPRLKHKILQLGEEIFSVHRALLCRASPVFGLMVEPGPVSFNASTKEQPVPEGSDSTCPLKLDDHGSLAEWNQFFDFIYVPQ